MQKIKMNSHKTDKQQEKKVIKIMLSAFEMDESDEDENTTSGMNKLRKIFNRQDIKPGVEFEHNGETYKILDIWD